MLTQPLTVFDLAQKTKALEAVFASPIYTNQIWKGLKLLLNISAVAGTSPTLDLKLQSYDPVGNVFIDMAGCSFPQKTNTGTAEFTVYPGIAETANVSVSDALPHLWRVLGAIGGTASAQAFGTLTSDATNPDPTGTITINSRVYTLVAALTEAKSAATLTSDGTVPADGGTFTLNTTVYTAKTTLTEVRASVTLTSDATNPADGGTITLGYGQYQITYTLKSTLTGAQNEIKIGATAAITLDNIKAAINASGTPGSEYSAVMQHPQIEATTNTDTTQLFQGRIGTAYTFDGGNVLESTEDATHLSFGGVVFAGGIASVANEVLIDASAAAFLDNVKSAVNGTTGAGTTYSTATVAHTTVDATTNTDTTQLFESKTVGVNAYASTETLSHTSFGGATFAGGAASVADEILIGAAAADTLDNIKSAINGTAGAGTTYSTATTANTAVTATTNTDTTQKFEAITTNATVGNAITTTEAATHLSFGAATLGGGVTPASFTFDLTGTLLS